MQAVTMVASTLWFGQVGMKPEPAERSESSPPLPAAPAPLKGERDAAKSDAETNTTLDVDAASTETVSSSGDSWSVDGEHADYVVGWSAVGVVFAAVLFEVEKSAQCDDDHDFPPPLPSLAAVESSPTPPLALVPLKGDSHAAESDAETDITAGVDSESAETDSSAGDCWSVDGENGEGVLGWSAVGVVFATALLEVAESIEDVDDDFSAAFPPLAPLAPPAAEGIDIASWGAVGGRLARTLGAQVAEELEERDHSEASHFSSRVAHSGADADGRRWLVLGAAIARTLRELAESEEQEVDAAVRGSADRCRFTAVR